MSNGDRPGLPLGTEPITFLHAEVAGASGISAASDGGSLDLTDEPILWLSVAGAAAPVGRRAADGDGADPDGGAQPGAQQPDDDPIAARPVLPATGGAPLPLAALLAGLGWVLRRRGGR